MRQSQFIAQVQKQEQKREDVDIQSSPEFLAEVEQKDKQNMKNQRKPRQREKDEEKKMNRLFVQIMHVFMQIWHLCAKGDLQNCVYMTITSVLMRGVNKSYMYDLLAFMRKAIPFVENHEKTKDIVGFRSFLRMQRSMFPVPSDDGYYEAGRILGFTKERDLDSFRREWDKPMEHQFAVEYEGWTARELFQKCADQMHEPFSCEDGMPWLDTRLPKGTYFVTPKFPGTHGLDYDDASHRVVTSGPRDGRLAVASVIIVASALLCRMRLNGGKNFLGENIRVRCVEEVGEGNVCHVVLWFNADGKLCVGASGDNKAESTLYLAGVDKAILKDR